MACVYFAIHLETGRVYVGKTVQKFAKRRRQHLRDAKHQNATYFERALRKHGIAAFDFFEAEHHDTDAQAQQAEKFWISYLRNQGALLFNLTDGGDGSAGFHRESKPLSDEHKRKLSEVGRGQPKTAEHKAKIGAAQLGISVPRRGRPLSEERKRHLSETRKGERNPRYGKPALNRGVPATEEAKQKNREAQLRNAELRRAALRSA